MAVSNFELGLMRNR